MATTFGCREQGVEDAQGPRDDCRRDAQTLGLLLELGELGEADAAEVLVRYKGQESVERRYGNFKGPLAGGSRACRLVQLIR